MKLLVPLIRLQQGNRGDRLLGIGGDPFEQRLEVAYQTGDRCLVEQIRVVLQGGRHRVAHVQHHQHQIERGPLLSECERFQPECTRIANTVRGWETPGCRGFCRMAQCPGLVPTEGHLEQR